MISFPTEDWLVGSYISPQLSLTLTFAAQQLYQLMANPTMQHYTLPENWPFAADFATTNEPKLVAKRLFAVDIRPLHNQGLLIVCDNLGPF